jgi:AraC-like DNA-binding protein
MGLDMNATPSERLERLCGESSADWIRTAPGGKGLQRAEAFFEGHAYDAHRHDSYAIGMTLQGVQAFRYRGVETHSLGGQVFVLHPDELHDGHAGGGTGFRYRILYVDPAAIHEALGEAWTPLPFVREVVGAHPRIAAVLARAFADLERPLEDLQRDDIVAGLAEELAAADPTVRRPLPLRHWRAALAARELLETTLERPVTSPELETAAGLSRYAVARAFRACFGTSPHWYGVLQRLRRARTLLTEGVPLVDVAAACGFADQSHMTRQFKQAYGVPPGRWAALGVQGQTKS